MNLLNSLSAICMYLCWGPSMDRGQSLRCHIPKENWFTSPKQNPTFSTVLQLEVGLHKELLHPGWILVGLISYGTYTSSNGYCYSMCAMAL